MSPLRLVTFCSTSRLAAESARPALLRFRPQHAPGRVKARQIISLHRVSFYVVQQYCLFNNNEQPIIMNMNPNLTRYQGQLQAWMPGARIVPPNTKFPTVDAMVEWKGPLGPVRYIAEWKAHFRYQD